MSNLKRVMYVHMAILITLAFTACTTHSPTATLTPQNTPTRTASFTPKSSATPTRTPTLEIAQYPTLPKADLEGDFRLKNGRVLSYKCFGEGSPTVIVEPGAYDRPTQSMSWNAVMLGVAPVTRICVYDRMPVNTTEEGAENLHELLSSVPIAGPYILAAHSLGGWFARVYTHLYPEDVSGMILLDASSTAPNAGIIYATAYPTYSPDESTGVTQNRMSEADIYQIPASLDGLEMETSNEQVRQASFFGDLPLVVICHTPGPEELAGVDPALWQTDIDILIKIEAELTTLSSKGVFVQASTQHHFITEYQPQIVIDTINQMVKDIRNP